MNNIGFYIDLSNKEHVNIINNILIPLKNKVDDISIFYNNIDSLTNNLQCGLFNSSALWHFSGKLFTMDLDILSSASQIINSIDLYYIYNKYDNSFNILKMFNFTFNYNILSHIDDKVSIHRLVGTNKNVKYFNKYEDLAQ